MSDIPAMPYELLWGERVLRSVANLTRADAEEFLALAPTVPVRTRWRRFPLEQANDALARMRDGQPPRLRRARALSSLQAARRRRTWAPPAGRRASRRPGGPRAPRPPLATTTWRPPSRSGRHRSPQLGGVRIEAGAPVHHPVALRVDRHEPHSARQRRGEVLPEGGAAIAVDAGALEEAGRPKRAQPADGLDLQPNQRMHRERVDLRRAQRNDPGHEIRPAACEHLGERAAAALADDRGLLSLFGDEPLEPLLQPRHQRARAVHVRHDAGPARPVAGALEPAGHHRQRAVARQKARDQQDRASAPVGHPVAAEDRVPQQRGGLEPDASLPPQRRTVTQRNEAQRSHRGLLTLSVRRDGSCVTPR